MSLEGKKVLVTGADGFIGSHLAETLVRAGASVRAMTLYNSFNSWGWLDGSPLLNELDIRCGDVRDADFVRAAVSGMDIVFHLAALIAIPYSYQAPRSYVDTNVSGTLNVLQAARDQGVGQILVASTSEVYGTARTVPISEAHPRQPQSPYSATKIAADALAESFHLSFATPVTIVRPFNTYGPRQSARAVIPTIMLQLLGGERRIKLGNLRPTRDLNYVEDTCRGFLMLAGCQQSIGKSVNVGSGREITIGDLALLIAKVVGSEIEIVHDEQRMRPEFSEVDRLLCDNTLINSLTGYLPSITLEEGIRRTVDWFRDSENHQRYKANIYNV
ncbi:NAD-dependent dehydratase [Bradyrhizobium sp. CCBAU 51745]|uniref:NAD-dependent 4,6-dehydratase LegB n=1 Tax=Bradyrhizobium sp. CCBAU 51745 TaxID=1325099 RepID=UPI00230655F5|nr:NAD-dependent 4,6-dehydratase LegB [Bradyrhizobium sp. CCBAU 51745]MDA9437529.1 NAD-dependent dehydratase [Bradyrhizobium sp. CCBAU 51745]